MAGVIPSYTFPVASTGLVSRSTLNTQRSIAEVQLTACAAGDYQRILFGRCRVGAQLLRPIIAGNAHLLLPFIIGRGPINGALRITTDDGDLDPAVEYRIYTGESTQAIDSWLQVAYYLQGVTYADTLPNIAWGLLSIPPNIGQAITGLTIEVEGLKLFDGMTTAYSANPTLALAALLSNPSWGKGETLDWSSVAACAAVDDQTIDGKERRSIGLVLDTPQPLDQAEQVLRAYAACWVVREGGTTRLVKDAPSSPVSFAYTNAPGSANYLLESLRIKEKRRKDSPTVVTIKYTDTSTDP